MTNQNKPTPLIFTFAVEEEGEAPYTAEWQEDNEAAARRQVEQRLRIVAPKARVVQLLGVRLET